MQSSLTIRITVRERLSERLAAAFDGVTLAPGTSASELVGEVVDQAQLHGLLSRIRDLGLTLQSVTVSDTDDPASDDPASDDPASNDPAAPPQPPVQSKGAPSCP